MGRNIFGLLLVFGTLVLGTGISGQAQGVSQTKVLKLMGSRFEITAVADNEAACWVAINTGIAEIQRIEKLISSWDPNSQTSSVNRWAGIKPIAVDQELFDLVARAKKVSKLTDGAFDISYASMDRLWKFDGTLAQVPADSAITRSLALIGYQRIILDGESNTVFLQDKGMKIGFGAIGKGYAANRARMVMKEMGITSGLVNAGGDLIAWGQQPDGSPWRIGITDPNNNEEVYSWLSINDQAVVTSGDYERFVMIEGRRYSHIIDPRNGYPVKGIKSVTIISPDAELSDALATSVFVLGEDLGLALINKLMGIECLIVTDDNRLIPSDKLHLNYYKP